MTTAGRGTWLKAGALLLLLGLGAMFALTVDVPDVASVRSWIQGAGGAGWTAMTVGLALVLLAPVPRSVVTVLIGVVAGFGPGLVIALAGGLLGGVAAFGLSRGLGRSAALRLSGPRLSRVDRLMVDRGFVPVLVGRLLPVVPFVVLSYGAGLTGVRFAPYVLGTALGLLPSTVLQVGVGAAVGPVADQATAFTLLAAALAAVAVLGALVLHRRRASGVAASVTG